MKALYHDPQGKKIFGNVLLSTENTTNVALNTERSQILALEREVQSLQAQLQQYSVSTNTEGVQAPVCHLVTIFRMEIKY